MQESGTGHALALNQEKDSKADTENVRCGAWGGNYVGNVKAPHGKRWKFEF